MELRGITWDHARGYECLVAASEKYHAQTGLKITWKKRSLQAFADASIPQLAQENDFIILDHPHVGLIAETEALRPLPPFQDQNASMGGSVESYVWNAKTWAYAVDAACQMAVRRPDLGAPMPVHWEDFRGESAADYRALTPLLPVDAFDMLMTLVAGKGETALPCSADEFVSENNGLYALDVLKSLYRLGPPEALDMNPIAVLEALSTTDEFACSPCLFGYVNYVVPGFRPHPLAYFDLPVSQGRAGSRAILGGAGIGISARTQYPEKALEFARWVTSEPVQSGVYLQNQGQPAHRQTWQAKKHDPNFGAFFNGGFDTIDTAWTRPRDPWFLGFVDDACEIMPAFFKRDLSNEAVLKQLNDAYRHHISGAK